MNKKKNVNKVKKLVQYYCEAITQNDIIALANLTRNPDLKNSSLYPALRQILDNHLDKDNIQSTYHYDNNPVTNQIGTLVKGWQSGKPNTKTSVNDQLNALVKGWQSGKPNTKTSVNDQIGALVKGWQSDQAFWRDPRTVKNVNRIKQLAKDLANEQSKTTINTAKIASLNAKIAELQAQIPQSVLQTIGMHPFTHLGAFAAGFGTAKLGDRFQRTVMKKDAGKRNADITGGFFNISKDKKRELNYLNKRLQKNILSKFRSFNGNEDEVIDYSKIQDPKLRSMISDLMSSLRSQGRWLTSQRDINKFRSQINAIERYMLNNNPELFYSRNNSGETTDLMHYLNSKYYKNPMDYIPDMHQALNREKDLIDKQLEPGKWRKRLQKWLA